MEPETTAEGGYTLELLHIADQEAGAAAVMSAPNLSAVLEALRAEELGGDGELDNTLTLSSGDAFIPGVFFDASEAVFGAGGVADIEIQNQLGVQAIALGNHEFDFGPRTLSELITGLDVTDDGETGDPDTVPRAIASFDGPALEGTALEGEAFDGAAFPYLSANLVFEADPFLGPLAVPGAGAPQPRVVTSSVVIDVNGEPIGVVGATTPTLPRISSPGEVGVLPEAFDADPGARAARRAGGDRLGGGGRAAGLRPRARQGDPARPHAAPRHRAGARRPAAGRGRDRRGGLQHPPRGRDRSPAPGRHGAGALSDRGDEPAGRHDPRRQHRRIVQVCRPARGRLRRRRPADPGLLRSGRLGRLRHGRAGRGRARRRGAGRPGGGRHRRGRRGADRGRGIQRLRRGVRVLERQPLGDGRARRPRRRAHAGDQPRQPHRRREPRRGARGRSERRRVDQERRRHPRLHRRDRRAPRRDRGRARPQSGADRRGRRRRQAGGRDQPERCPDHARVQQRADAAHAVARRARGGAGVRRGGAPGRGRPLSAGGGRRARLRPGPARRLAHHAGRHRGRRRGGRGAAGARRRDRGRPGGGVPRRHAELPGLGRRRLPVPRVGRGPRRPLRRGRGGEPSPATRPSPPTGRSRTRSRSIWTTLRRPSPRPTRGPRATSASRTSTSERRASFPTTGARRPRS